MPFTRLRYHFVIGTKFRRPWITADVEKFLYPVLSHTTERIGGSLIAIGGITDHVHMVSAFPPNISVSDAVDRLKSESTGALKRHRRDLWHFKWGVGYGCFTLAPFDLSKIVAYVRDQKKHHRHMDLWESFEVRDVDEEDEQ